MQGERGLLQVRQPALQAWQAPLEREYPAKQEVQDVTPLLLVVQVLQLLGQGLQKARLLGLAATRKYPGRHTEQEPGLVGEQLEQPTSHKMRLCVPLALVTSTLLVVSLREEQPLVYEHCAHQEGQAMQEPFWVR